MKKIIFNVIIILLVLAVAWGPNSAKATIQSGVGLGSIIAIAASWDRNKSILWAFLHGFLSWVYVIYYILSSGKIIIGQNKES